MREKGKAMMGMGEVSGANRVLTAAETAISNPLIEDRSIKRERLNLDAPGGTTSSVYFFLRSTKLPPAFGKRRTRTNIYVTPVQPSTTAWKASSASRWW